MQGEARERRDLALVGDAAGQGEPGDEHDEREGRVDKHRRLPAAKPEGNRDGEGGTDAGTDLKAHRVDTRHHQGVVGEALLDGDDHQRIADTHANANQQGHDQDAGQARHERAADARQPDQCDREADRVECPDASSEDWRKRGEEPKAEHGDRDEQSDHGMGHAQRTLDLWHQRPDSDELRSVHERGDEQTNQQWQAIANRLNRKATRRLLVCSHRGRMAERARVGPAARWALNLERWCPRAPTVGIRVGHELTL